MLVFEFIEIFNRIRGSRYFQLQIKFDSFGIVIKVLRVFDDCMVRVVRMNDWFSSYRYCIEVDFVW